MIELDVKKRRLHLDVTEDELARRRKAWKGFQSPHTSGYAKLYVDHVLQADKGVDFDFLVGRRGTPILRESH
jgi:L-arabonate dehydrase